MGSELKPCPFCGAQAQIEAMETDDEVVRVWLVRCGNWRCPVKPVLWKPYLRPEAIAAWNRRAGEGVSE